MRMTNSLLFVAFVLSGTLLLAQGQASAKVLNVSGTIVLSSIDTAGGMRADQVFALLSDNAGSDPSANTGDDPPVESTDPPNPCGNGLPANDPGVVIDNYNALVGQGISPTDAEQIAQITGETGI